MSDGTFMSWQEMQYLCLPPNSAMLVPPPLDPAEIEALSAGAPGQRPEWLDDEFQVQPLSNVPTTEQSAQPFDPEANEAAAQRAEYGEPAVRLLANAIAVGALLEMTRVEPKHDHQNDRRNPNKPEPSDR